MIYHMFVFKDSWNSAKRHFRFAFQISSFLYLIGVSLIQFLETIFVGYLRIV